jgi:hypothetical protein
MSRQEQVSRWLAEHPRDIPDETVVEHNLRLYTAFKADIRKGHVFTEKQVHNRNRKQQYLRNCKIRYLKRVDKSILDVQMKKISDLKKGLKGEKKSQSKKKKSTDSRKKREEAEDLSDSAPKIPVEDPGYFKFMRWLSVPEYGGLYKWQKEHHRLTWEAEYSMTLVARDHGKSVEYNGKYQWAIQYQEMDVLLLGWTDRRKEIAQYVYNFFSYYGLIKKDKRSSPFHFQTINGGRFDCYLITSKETLGMHSEGTQSRFSDMTEEDWDEYKSMFTIDLDEEADRVFVEEELEEYIKSRTECTRKLWISIDDPIDISFMKERHKETTLEMHFNSSLYAINPFKWSFTGTRKFEGDFFDFIDEKFDTDLVKYVKGAILPDGSLLCPERFTHPSQETYITDLKEGKRDLSKVRQHIGEYAWFSEFQQEPHPLLGEVWRSVDYVQFLDTPVNRMHDLCWITIDRATTTKITSDWTGCVIGVRESKTGHRITTHDFSGMISLDSLLVKINDFVIEFHDKFDSIAIMMVVEKQGGGDDFITMALNTKVFTRDDGTLVKNMIPSLVTIIPIHNTGNKLDRIKQRLMNPLKNRTVKFMIYMKHSEIIREILEFPHPAKLDAIDALANSEFVILEEYSEVVISNPVEQMTHMYRVSDYETERDLSQEIIAERQLRSKLKAGRQQGVNVF